jgi:hypothetical protein
VFRSLLKARRYEFDVERTIYLTVLHRLFASGSDRAARQKIDNVDPLVPSSVGGLNGRKSCPVSRVSAMGQCRF